MGDVGGVRDDAENGDPRDWGDHGNLDLHGWTFDRFTKMPEYKAASEGITVELVSVRGTSQSSQTGGRMDDNQRVARGLYVCEEDVKSLL